MSPVPHPWLAAAGQLLAGAVAAYAVLAWWLVRGRERREARRLQAAGALPGGAALQPAPLQSAGAPPPARAAQAESAAVSQRKGAGALPGVTVLKPLCGAEPTLYACLRSFCELSYPGLQIVCGVRDPQDPAIAVVQRLQREFPALALELVIDARQHGASLKVSNLINMMNRARHEVIVLADADVCVPRDYLPTVVDPLADPQVGLVTCAYRGRPVGGVWAVLLATFINEWFMPSVYVAGALGSQMFVSGATIALRRQTLSAIGGFAAIADQLADDYRLGELTRRHGLGTRLTDLVVDTWVEEHSLTDLVRHELRWLRTIRIVQPAGYAACVVTFGVPVALIGCLLAAGSGASLALLGVTAGARLLLHFAIRRAQTPPPPLWVLPFNDLLAFALWCWGFLSRRVHWRQALYRVAADGSVRPIA